MPEGGRVIAGRAKGIRLEVAGTGTRPLSDRVKQALFGSLEAEGALSGGFLDLFAGTGAAGIEALSRGATHATFVEDSTKACALIRSNLQRAALGGGSVVCRDVARFLAEPTAGNPPYDAVFIDPPYDAHQLLVRAVEALGEPDAVWLTAQAVVVAKHFWRDEPPLRVGTIVRSRQKRFGETMLSYYTRKATVDAGL